MKRFFITIFASLAGIAAIYAADSVGINALKISLRNGETHYIAIDGNNLELNVSANAIRLGNSGITVEYDSAETHKFTPANYQFPAGKLYLGNKQDISGSPVVADDAIILQLSGQTLTVSGIAGNGKVTLHSDKGMLAGSTEAKDGIASFDVSSLAGGAYILHANDKSVKILLGN